MKRLIMALTAIIILFSVGAVTAFAAEGDTGLKVTFKWPEGEITPEDFDDFVEDNKMSSLSDFTFTAKTGEETNNFPLLTFKQDLEVFVPVELAADSDSTEVVLSLSSQAFYVEPVQISYTGGEQAVEIQLAWNSTFFAMYKQVQSLKNEDILKENSKEWGEDYVDGIFGSIDGLLKQFTVTGNLINADTYFANDAVSGIVKKVYDAIFPISVMILALIWVISVGKSGISMELYSKSMVKPLLRFVWALIIMQISIPVTQVIFSIFHELQNEVFGGGFSNNVAASYQDLYDEAKSQWVDDSFVIGGLLTFLEVVKNIPKITTALLMEVIFGFVFYIVVAIRFLKLATMQAISPFFFAFSASEKTERYLHSFLVEYAISAAQVFVAMIMYNLTFAMYAGATDAVNPMSQMLGIIIYIAGIITAVGSGKFLRSLTH